VLFEKAVLGKPCTLEKNFLHMKYSADRLVLMNETKKISTLFRWVYWVKTGVDLLFFYFAGSLRSFKALQNFQTHRVCS